MDTKSFEKTLQMHTPHRIKVIAADAEVSMYYGL